MGPPKRRVHQNANFTRGSNLASTQKILNPLSLNTKTHTQDKDVGQKQAKRMKQNGNKSLCSAPMTETQHKRTKKQARLQTNSKPTINNRSNCTTRAPLAMEVASTTRGLETLKEEWQVELYACLYTFNNRHSTRLYTMETKIIPWQPNRKFTNIQDIYIFLLNYLH